MWANPGGELISEGDIFQQMNHRLEGDFFGVFREEWHHAELLFDMYRVPKGEMTGIGGFVLQIAQLQEGEGILHPLFSRAGWIV